MSPERQGPIQPHRTEMQYAEVDSGSVDWSRRGTYVAAKHGISIAVANEALADTNRVVIEPDYNSASGRSIRVIGYSVLAESVITVIVLPHRGVDYGVNAWLANEKDRRIYREEADNGQA